LQSYAARAATLVVKPLNNQIIQAITLCTMVIYVIYLWVRFQHFVLITASSLSAVCIYAFGFALFTRFLLGKILIAIIPFLIEQTVTAINKLNLDRFVEYDNVRKKIDDAKQLWNQQISVAIEQAEQRKLQIDRIMKRRKPNTGSIRLAHQ